jgi:hypothetical protein
MEAAIIAKARRCHDFATPAVSYTTLQDGEELIVGRRLRGFPEQGRSEKSVNSRETQIPPGRKDRKKHQKSLRFSLF